MVAKASLEKLLAGPTFLPVVAIISPSALLVHEAVTAVRRKVVSQAAADFNSDAFVAGQTPIAQVLTAAGTLPMLAPRRWVHLADIHRLVAKDQAPLLHYLSRPAPSTVLCLSGEKLDLRTKLGQALNKSGALFVRDIPRPAELPLWVSRRAASLGLTIDSDAAALLAELVGGELGTLAVSLEKVALYAGDGQPVSVEDVAAAVAATRVASVFELTDAMGQRNWPAASLLLRNILGGGESGLLVLAMLVRQVRQLIALKSLPGHLSGAAQAAQLGIRPFLIDQVRAQAERFTMAQLQAALAAAHRADTTLKSSRLSHGLILDGLLAEIAGAA